MKKLVGCDRSRLYLEVFTKEEGNGKYMSTSRIICLFFGGRETD